MRKPDFIIGGAPRCGTTWLYQALDLHPELYMAKPVTPEPKFFLVDAMYEQGFEYYCMKWFESAPPMSVTGEKSTNYLESVVAAKRIHTYLPHVKLIFLLREPVDRAFNNWLWSRTNGVESESFEDALALENERERNITPTMRYARPHALFSRGLYADQLSVYFDLFQRNQILVLRFEDIALSPESILEHVHLFLGVTPRPKDSKQLGVINRAMGELTLSINPVTQKRLQDAYTEHNNRLAKLLGDDMPFWEYT